MTEALRLRGDRNYHNESCVTPSREDGERLTPTERIGTFLHAIDAV